MTMTNEESKLNVSTLQREIENLKSGHWNMFKRQYREFWDHAKQISGMFKTLKPLLPQDREQLWAEFNSICEEVKREKQRESESRITDSKNKRDLVESKIREAYFQAKGARSSSELSEAKVLLNKALDWMKNGWSGFNLSTQIVGSMFSEGKMLKTDSDACWEQWKEANEVIKFRRQELGDIDYNRFRSKASEAMNAAHHGEAREAKSKVKELQGEMKEAQMSRSQFQEIRGMLDSAWQKANSHLEEAYREGQRKHEEWVSRTLGHIERWNELIHKNEDVVSRIEQQIEKCRDMERDAKSSEFAETVRGWIEEKYSKISDIRESIKELEEKIRSAKNKLRE